MSLEGDGQEIADELCPLGASRETAFAALATLAFAAGAVSAACQDKARSEDEATHYQTLTLLLMQLGDYVALDAGVVCQERGFALVEAVFAAATPEQQR